MRRNCTIYFIVQVVQDFTFADFKFVQIFLDEIIIEEAIQDGICTGGWNPNHMADKEADHHCLCKNDKIF